MESAIDDLLQIKHGIRGGVNLFPATKEDDYVPDLYPLYVAYIDSHPIEETKGEDTYTSLTKSAFNILSRTLQLREFSKLGLTADTESSLLQQLLPDDPNVPSFVMTADLKELPLLTTMRRLRHITVHIGSLDKDRSKLIQKARSAAHDPRSSPTAFQDHMAEIHNLTTAIAQDRRLHQALTN